uniref:Cytochrome P450 family 17 subfamily A member 1 n=1 Tax=Sinocyclocheilus grahami TaxID=75366 RepID=A0A672NRG5_SINGR
MNGFAPGDRSPPSIPSLSIIGSLLNCPCFFQQLQKKYGDLYSLMMGSHKVLIVNNHHHAKEVLIKKGKIFAGRPRTVIKLLVNSRWERYSVSLCMFGEGSVSIEKIICREASSMCDMLTDPEHAVDLAPELTCAVTNVVCALCFNSSYKRGDAEFESMLRYSQGIVDTDSLVDIFPWLQIFPNKDLKILRQCVSVRDKLLQKKYEEHKVNYSDNVQRDLLDALLRAKRSSENNNTSTHDVGLTEDRVLRTVGDIFGAGVEITTTVLKWSIAYLVHNPPVQRKVQQELDNKIGKDRHPQLSDRGNLPYLEATIREVLRIRPVSPLLIPHVALQDTSVGEYTVQKGTRVIINPCSSESVNITKYTESSNPIGRFLNEEGDGLCCPSASYLPFGAGVRVCLGEALAKMELFLFLSWILQKFTMPTGQPLSDLQDKFGVVLQHKKFKVIAKLRADWEKNPTNAAMLGKYIMCVFCTLETFVREFVFMKPAIKYHKSNMNKMNILRQCNSMININ